MLKLYNYPDCPFCQKVRVVLAEKDLEYEKVLVDLRKQDQKTPEFLQLNPYGKVPVLVDEDTVVYDSTIINEYLDEEYPIPALMPEDSQSKAQVRTLEDYCDNSFLPSAGFVQAELSKPTEEQDAERLARYRNELQRGLKRLEGFLGGKEYLVGEFSLADVSFVPALIILPRLGIEVDPALRGVNAWINRLKQRPSVQSLDR